MFLWIDVNFVLIGHMMFIVQLWRHARLMVKDDFQEYIFERLRLMFNVGYCLFP